MTDGTAEIAAAWDTVLAGSPAVLRFSGSPSRALEPLAAHLVDRWEVAALPEGPSKILWFDAGAASEAAADVVVTAVVLLQIPWLVVLSGPRAADRGLPWGLHVPGGAEGSVEPTDVHSDRFDLDLADPDAVEASVLALGHAGRICEAAALLDTLRSLDPERAAAHRWLDVARCFYLAREDVLETARRAMQDTGPGLARVLAFAGQATVDRQVSMHLLRRAVRSARTDDARQDATYYLHRAEIAMGQRPAAEAGEPAHPLMLSMARFGPASREAYRNKAPGPAHAALEAIGNASAEALLGWVTLRYDLERAQWLDVARGFIAVGLARSAGWMLFESVQYQPENAQLRAGLEQLHSPRMGRALELTLLLNDFDVVRAKRLAPELLRPENNTAVRCYGQVLLAASAAALDDDPGPLAELHRPDIRDQLQESFCQVLAHAADQSNLAMRVRLLALAVDWAAQIPVLETDRKEWLEQLRTEDPERVPLGRYTLEQPVGAGGMGAVWLGQHSRLGQSVAVKFLLRDAMSHVEAFEEEVAVLASLDHPAVVQVLDVGQVTEATEAITHGELVAGTPYLVMEYVPGGTLTDYRGTLGWDDVRDILLAMLDGLAYVHARGIVHRDLKPQNVLVGQTPHGLQVRLSDFGLAGAHMKGRVAGTPAYMAPEQFSGTGVGPWSDLYAVACVATALLSGLPPFLGSSNQLVRAHRSRPVPPLEAVTPVPEGFEAWRLKLLEKAPEDRFPNARAASLALRALPPAPVWDLPDDPAEEHFEQSFVFETMVGMIEPELPTLSPSQAGFRTLLPRQGFAHRPVRPRLPTDRLFGRFPSPCIGQAEVRSALWEHAVRAYDEEAVLELAVAVPRGLGLDRVMDWARSRLRELGVDASDDGHGDFVLQVGGEAPYGPALVVRVDPDAPVSLSRLTALESVAQIRTQVEVSPGLAWELARRGHGLPDLVDRVLAEVIRHPGLVPGEGGLVASGVLPQVFEGEKAHWRALLESLSDAERAEVEACALQPPDQRVDDGVAADLCIGPAGRRALATGLRVVVLQDLADRGVAEARHRARLSQGLPAWTEAWHRLGAGEPETAERLLATLEPTPASVAAWHRALDLQLVPLDDSRRPASVPGIAPPPTAPATDALVAGDLPRAWRLAAEGLAERLRRGDPSGGGVLKAIVLAARAGEADEAWDAMVETCEAEWSADLRSVAIAEARRGGREDRVERLQRL